MQDTNNSIPIVDQGILIDGSIIPPSTSVSTISKLEKIRERMYTPTDKNNILYMLNNRVNVVRYSDLDSYSSFEELIGPYQQCIILYPHTPDGNVGHWCTVFSHSLTSDRAEFFDAYGFYIDDPIDDYNDRMHDKHKLEPKLLDLILASKYANNFHYNEIPYQSESLATDTCGLWAVYRLKNKHLDEYEFRKICLDLPVEYNLLPDLVMSKVILDLFPEL